MEAQATSIDPLCHSAYEKFIEITTRLEGEGFGEKTPSEVEAYLESDGRELLRLLLQEPLASRGAGRVGDAVGGADGVVRTHRRDAMPKGYKSVFGEVRVERTGYRGRGAKSLFVLDAQLNLPAQGYSHRLQKRVSVKAVKESFEEVAKDLAAETGVRARTPAHRKRMATVAGLYHVERHIRCPKAVARQFAPLHRVPEKRPPGPKPVAKTLRASLEKPMKAVIDAGFEEALRRDPEQRAEWVALVDGDPTQIDYIEHAAQHHEVTVTVILDIIHVVEYLWKAANALFDAADVKRPAWVADKIERLLQGQARALVRSLRRSATLKGLRGKPREPLDQCLTYLANHAPHLNYPHYLSRGYPIATGVIEGACRYLVKDRMEITGARWGLPGAEAVLKLRALYLNGDFEGYWAFHEQQEYHRNHEAKFAHVPRTRPQLQLIPGGKS